MTRSTLRLAIAGVLMALVSIGAFSRVSAQAKPAAQDPAAIAAAAEHAVFYRRIAELSQAQNFELAELLLKDRLEERPGDPTATYGLAALYVDRNRGAEAKALRTRLAASPDSLPFVKLLDAMIAQNAERQALKERIKARLQAFDGDGAVTLLNSAGASPIERAALMSKIELYRGRFAGAMQALLPLRSTTSGQKEFAQQLEIATAAAELYKSRLDRIEWYLSSPLGSTSCTPDQAAHAAANASFTLTEYATLVSQSFIEHPLNDWLMDVAFHAALVSSPYEQVEAFGDLVLRAKGTLKIPFFDRMQRFWLVIDAKERRLYTEVDAKRPKNDYGSDDLQVVPPFSIAFNDVRRIQQSANSDLAGRFMKRDSYALRMEPANKVAPYYLFMPLIHCVYGEAAQKTVTRSLGQFLVHAMAPHAPAAVLADPATVTKDWLGRFTNITAWGGAAAEMTLTISLSRGSERKDNFAPDVAIDRALALQGNLQAERARVSQIVDAQKNSGSLFFETATDQLNKLFERLNAQTLFDALTSLGGADQKQ